MIEGGAWGRRPFFVSFRLVGGATYWFRSGVNYFDRLMAKGMAEKLPGGRLFHLDALRAFCMLYGIMVHGATIDSNAFFSVVKGSSDLFRMATFMLISGFFTTMVAMRTTVPHFYRSRISLLVYPLLATLLLLNPVTIWLIHTWSEGPMTFGAWLNDGWREPVRAHANWHLHLWFLFSLIAYAVVTPLLLLILRRPLMIRAIDRYCDLTDGWTVWANVLLVGMMVVAARTIYTGFVEQFSAATPFSWIAAATMTYFPYFLLGMLAFLNRRLFRSLHVLSWPGLILAGALYLGVQHFGADLPRAAERTLHWLGRTGLMMFIICALMHLFERYLNRPSQTLAFFVEASYTFYLFHILVIFTLAHLLAPFAMGNAYILYALTIALGTPLALGIHRFLIAPVPLLRFIFNGKRSPPRRTAAVS